MKGQKSGFLRIHKSQMTRHIKLKDEGCPHNEDLCVSSNSFSSVFGARESILAIGAQIILKSNCSTVYPVIATHIPSIPGSDNSCTQPEAQEVAS